MTGRMDAQVEDATFYLVEAYDDWAAVVAARLAADCRARDEFEGAAFWWLVTMAIPQQRTAALAAAA